MRVQPRKHKNEVLQVPRQSGRIYSEEGWCTHPKRRQLKSQFEEEQAERKPLKKEPEPTTNRASLSDG